MFNSASEQQQTEVEKSFEEKLKSANFFIAILFVEFNFNCLSARIAGT